MNAFGVGDVESGCEIDDGLKSCDCGDERIGARRRWFLLKGNFLEVVQRYWTAPRVGTTAVVVGGVTP